MTISDFFRRLWPALASFLISVLPLGAAPFVQGFAPDFGPPGTQVVIRGSGFRPTATPPIVQFGTAQATLVSANQTTIVAVVPNNATIGPVTVTVPNGGGQYTTPFFFYLPPRITDFGTEPQAGPDLTFKKPVVLVPGGTLTIVGANFFVPGFPALLVKVGSTPLNATVTAETQIRAQLPALLETGYVSVLTQVGGTTNTSEYFYGPPRITRFTPRAAAGDTIEIVGINFLTQVPSQIEVTLGGVKAAVDVKSNTNLLAIVPATSLSGRVSVAVPGGTFITTSNLTILPKIESFTPGFGPPGTVVAINGSGLTGTTQVRFGTLASTAFTNISQTQVNAVVPANAQTSLISVTTGTGTNVSTTPFFVAPSIANFSPSAGNPGTKVTVNGLNFTGATDVQLNGVSLANFTVVDNEQITFFVPESASSGKIRVITPAGSAESGPSFTVRGPQPFITRFTPASGGPGTAVTIIGGNLAAVTNVTFNGARATFNVVQQTNLLATVPANATTGKIRVTSPDGGADSTENFVFGTTADVRILFTGNPNPAVAYGVLVYNVQAFNNGPLTAQNAVIEVDLPPGLALIETTGPLAPVISGQKLTYNRGSLEVGGVFLAGIRVNAGAPTNAIAFARITSSTPDTNPDNNSRFVTNAVALPRLAIESVDPTEVLLSWPSAAGSLYQLNSSTSLNGPFSPVPGNAADDGDRLLLTVPATNSLQLFRLNLVGP
ncbi:MAG: IPT/TIG domain-containing protein [Verrucomicrobia bacterium]|nr:IPT/TIG domain-containing protein [Verrucomicrobiota bacterium]